MWIHSIKLRNFKSYRDAAFSFPQPTDNQNIVLIGAQNGHGKTTLLEAVYLCLYDKDALPHLHRAGLKHHAEKVRLADFLQSALHHKAEPRYGQYFIELELEIRHSEQSGLRIRRKWHFNHEKKYTETAAYADLYQNGEYRLLESQDINKFLNLFAIPIDYAPFFFFDGEKIVKTAESSGAGTWLKSALTGLLGITLLERLRESLKDYKSKCISENASKKIQDDLNHAERELASAENKYLDLQNELTALESILEQHASQRDYLTQQLGGSSDIRSSAELLQLREQLEKESTEFNNRLKAAVKAMPLAFLPRDRLNKLQTQLLLEKNRLNHEAGKNQIAEKVDDFWNAFIVNQKVKNALGTLAETILNQPSLKEALEECWNDLFYPLPSECADKIQHNYLSVNSHAEIENEIGKLRGMPQEPIGKLLEEIENRDAKRKDIAVEIESLKGSNNDELVEQLKQITKESEQFKENYGVLKTNLVQASKNREHKRKEVLDLQNRISDSNPKLLKSRRADLVDKVIIRLSEELLKQKIQEISDVATRINHEIAHDQRIGRIRVESTGRMILFGSDGCASQVDLSAGQTQILIMSLVSALAEVTHYKAPFIIDTPLARLDADHREGLFQHWGKLSQQVILLSQDTEITTDVYERLSQHINKTYLIQAESLDTAGAHSKVIADEYFQHALHR